MLVTLSMKALRFIKTVTAKSGLVIYVSSGVSCLGSRLSTVRRTMRSISFVTMFGVVGSGVWFLSTRISPFSSVVNTWYSLRELV